MVNALLGGTLPNGRESSRDLAPINGAAAVGVVKVEDLPQAGDLGLGEFSVEGAGDPILVDALKNIRRGRSAADAAGSLDRLAA